MLTLIRKHKKRLNNYKYKIFLEARDDITAMPYLIRNHNYSS